MHEVAEAFRNALTDHLKPAAVLSVGSFEPAVFVPLGLRQEVPMLPGAARLEKNANYDLILGEFAWISEREKSSIDGRQRTVMAHWLTMVGCAASLSTDGYGAFVMEPAVMWKDDHVLLDLLADRGLSLSGVFQLPVQFYPTTAIRPLILLISRKPCKSTFFGELVDPDQIERIVATFLRGEAGDSLLTGVHGDPRQFRTFEAYRLERQIDVLLKQYGEYSMHVVEDLAEAVNTVKRGERFEPLANSVYITKHKSGFSSTALPDPDEKRHENLFQIVLRPDKLDATYFAGFFKTELGRLLLESLMTGATIQRVSKASLLALCLPIPPMVVQQQIAETSKALSKLQGEVSSFLDELALNPSSSVEIFAKIGPMLEALGRLSKADTIRAKIRQGESKSLEFKETLSFCLREKKKQKYIEDMAIKTVAAFMNSEGGTLLVGVRDTGEIVGLENELARLFHDSRDKLLLHFKNIFKSRIGESFYPFVDYGLVDCDGALVLFADCQQADRPCYVDGKDFFVRTNPATDKLEGPKLVDYVHSHFGSRGR